MMRAPCCDKMGLKKGPWTPEEDHILITHIQKYGHQNWRALPKQAGLLRCGKSCRLRWINYLRPDIKRGNFSHEEEETILKLHGILGNKWSAIAARLPGRTDNEIKNFWYTHLKKRAERSQMQSMSNSTSFPLEKAQASCSSEAEIRMAQVAKDASNATTTSNEKNPPIVGVGFYSTEASNGCNEIDEEMEFWYNLFIQTGH
ncbi:hypothetical protein Lal_00047672 [Lupinus albus]|uniref:Putative transcription factor MYB-HB-like family n=1 Tax=Lupinus albus TaxID=3870 RepID=A0A6A4QXC6_LUPAL|nr:putative transcription factor MYB-HB-like family [Lupinus albus]KAF1879000.1 hypothetical protein Lal_00047672 [Lupinus albus]